MLFLQGKSAGVDAADMDEREGLGAESDGSAIVPARRDSPPNRKEYDVAIRLNHTIVSAHDKATSATFLTEILGLPAPSLLGPFAVVRVGETSLDYMDVKEYRGDSGEITPQHYAFLVSESEFDEIFARIRDRRLPYWADPGRQERDQINTWDDGRGLYFDDPNGHLLEIITRPYGSGGTAASHPHPLIAPTLDPAAPADGAVSGNTGKGTSAP